ncbi:MAG: imidazole glycerol phosphate synthase subunit HisH [Patescibacteria group bacterium]
MSEKSKKITVVDYGVGNLQSINKALQACDVEVEITEEADKIKSAQAIILPGVGSFEAGMRGLKLRGLEEVLKSVALKDIPILGICLGAQLLLSKGYEFGEYAGLGIIFGQVMPFPVLAEKEKIPHICWNKIRPPNSVLWQDTILKNQEEKEVYFVHSYILKPQDEVDCLATAVYGGYEFCSAIKKGNIYGCQFHPEKSGLVGLAIINNFVKLIEKSN